MKRKQETGYDYKATPPEYPISDNNVKSTYDQFIQLRDTLILCNKYYADKAGRSLIIGSKLDGTVTNTIEIFEPNYFRQGYEPGFEDDVNKVQTESTGKYIIKGDHPNILSCEIVRSGRYIIQHKEQFKNIDSSITRILASVLHHYKDSQGQRQWNERAVFDWEWNTAGEIKRMTSFGYVECDCNKGDRLEFTLVDQNGDHINSQGQLQANSNRWSIDYKDLPYKVS